MPMAVSIQWGPKPGPEGVFEKPSIRYYEGVLIIRAPDYIQRQIGGYPFAPRRRAAPTQRRNGRYVSFSAPISIIENVKFRGTTVTGSTGGTGNP